MEVILNQLLIPNTNLEPLNLKMERSKYSWYANKREIIKSYKMLN